MALSPRNWLMNLGAARAMPASDVAAVVIAVAPVRVYLTYHLDRMPATGAPRGALSLRTNLTEDYPASCGILYLRSSAVEGSLQEP